MPRRSRQRSGARKPVIIAVILIVLLSAWFWQQQRARHAEVGEVPEVAAPVDGQGAARTQAELPLPPIESTRPGAEAAATPVPGATPPAATAASASALPAFLPPEAHATLRLIGAGGPFPHRQDGNVFGNREGRLPSRPRGYYREYTVDTPGLGHRGTRRIVTGGDPPSEYYYSDDHYESFRRFQVPAGQVRR